MITMNMNKKLLFLIVLLAVVIFPNIAPAVAAGTSIANPLTGVPDFQTLICNIAVKVSELVGALGTLMLLVAGIFYVTSAGDPGRVTAAKKALTFAIAGMAIGLAAVGIVGLINQIIGSTASVPSACQIP